MKTRAGFRRPLAAAAAAAILAAAAGAAGAEPASNAVLVAADRTVSVHAERGEARELMVALCRGLGARLYWDPGIERSVSLHADRAPIERVLPRLLGPLNYGVVWRPDPSAGPSAYLPAEILVYRDGMKAGATLAFDGAGADGPGGAGPGATPAAGTNDIPDLVATLAATGDVRRCLSAARTLAALGTPAAVGPLFDALGSLPPGGLGDEIARIAGGVTNRESARLLSAYMVSSDDPRVARAAVCALGATADAALLRELHHAHGTDPALRGYARFAETLAGVTSRDAEEAVAGFAGPKDRPPADPVARAAVTALSRIGTATAADQLVERLELAEDGSGGDLAAAVAGLSPTPQALAALRYAAAGNKSAQKESTRLTAIRGLARFPDSETVSLMRELATDPSPAIREEAGRLLQFLEGDGR